MSKFTSTDAPERVIVVGSPTFGQGIKFILFGAFLGFTAAYYFLGGISKRSVAAKAKAKAKRKATEKVEDAMESLEDTVDAVGESVEERLKSVAGRVRKLSHLAKETIGAAGVVVKPAIDRAVAEGKKAAAEVENRLKKEVEDAGDKPFLAEQDGTLDNQKENKNGE
jgi:hypothetical protein